MKTKEPRLTKKRAEELVWFWRKHASICALNPLKDGLENARALVNIANLILFYEEKARE